jgi:peptidoglycan/LPS O-acetylase OafA/YrhL
MKFHYLAAGALTAWIVVRDRQGVMQLPIFSNRGLQLALAALLVDFYGFDVLGGWVRDRAGTAVAADVYELRQLVLYPWLLLTVSMNPRNLLRFDTPCLDYLGKISYGIYMYQMIVLYLVGLVFKVVWPSQGSFLLYTVTFYVLAIGLTLAVAHLSYERFERRFLHFKDYRLEWRPKLAIAEIDIAS